MKMDTVSIDTPNGPVRINHADYKAEQHTLTDPQPDWSSLFGQPAPAPVVPGTPGAPMAPLTAPAQPVPPANVDTAAVPVAPPVAPDAPTPPPAPLEPAPPAANADQGNTNPPPPPAPTETFVTKLDNTWFVVDQDGKPVAGKNGESDAGYSTKKDAEAANKA